MVRMFPSVTLMPREEIMHSDDNKYPLGPVVGEGKTKVIRRVKHRPDLAIIISKDDITAGDGAKHDQIPGKARWSTTTTCNVFKALKNAGVPLAFVEQDSETSFIASLCAMLSYEVVVRREAHGSYLKRNPAIPKGFYFGRLLVEFFLKTKDKRWGEYELKCDDPLMSYREDAKEIDLYLPDIPLKDQKPFLQLRADEVFTNLGEHLLFRDMSRYATLAFLVLEECWAKLKLRLVDFKIEFGTTTVGTLVLADVIDNDSWRLIQGENYLDKQVYRDGGDIIDVARNYELIADLTRKF